MKFVHIRVTVVVLACIKYSLLFFFFVIHKLTQRADVPHEYFQIIWERVVPTMYASIHMYVCGYVYVCAWKIRTYLSTNEMQLVACIIHATNCINCVAFEQKGFPHGIRVLKYASELKLRN